MEQQELKARIEAVLFITAKAMEVKDIAEILGAESEEVEQALLELIMDYSAREGALEIDDENGYILQVKTEFMDIVEKLCPVELAPAVLKTLTVIAIKEPIRQAYLKELRGSTAYDHVKELVEKGLISRNKDKNGRSFNLKTTSKFAEYFKLKGDTQALAKILDIEKKGLKDNGKEDISSENDEQQEQLEQEEE
ncbi:SMC-Scp complex subunit ScpB [bacterium]|nr:SMC-Scp complex subunit ScpB [bacterium]